MHTKANQPRRTKVKGTTGVYRSSSGRYEFSYTDSDGRFRFETCAPGTTLEQAKAERASIVSRKAKGERVAPTRMRFADWAEEWLGSLNRRERTIAAHRYALDKHLLPRFRNRLLHDITTDDVARMVAEMERKGFAPWTILGTLSTLSGCLRRAVRRGMIASNPVAGLERDERPTVTSKEKRLPTEEEMTRLLKVAGDFRAIIGTLAFGGLRISEALALRWQDIDFDEHAIRVRYQLNLKRELVEPKTRQSRREVELTAQLAQILREHRIASRFKAATDFVFASPTGRGRDQRSVARGIKRALKRAKLDGLGISAHGFRHWFASYLIVGLKLDAVTVAEQLGHANPGITMRVYAHEFRQAKGRDELREAMSAGFGKLVGTGVSS